jgi:predicted  nucleic acid-binding Zn-ribbon protein
MTDYIKDLGLIYEKRFIKEEFEKKDEPKEKKDKSEEKEESKEETSKSSDTSLGVEQPKTEKEESKAEESENEKCMVKCFKCGDQFDYNDQNEIAMGTVKCPKCGENINQSNSEEEDSTDQKTDSLLPQDSTQSKVSSLQKQYNDLIVTTFTKYAQECVSNALEGQEGAFGANIEQILDKSFCLLKNKVLNEFGMGDKEQKIEITIVKPIEGNVNPVAHEGGLKMEKKIVKNKRLFKNRMPRPDQLDMSTRVHKNEKDVAKERKFDWKKHLEQEEL